MKPRSMEAEAIAGVRRATNARADERSEDAENAVIGVERFPPLDGRTIASQNLRRTQWNQPTPNPTTNHQRTTDQGPGDGANGVLGGSLGSPDGSPGGRRALGRGVRRRAVSASLIAQ